MYNKLLDSNYFNNTRIYPDPTAEQALYIQAIRPQYNDQSIAQYITYSSQSHWLMNVSDETSNKKINVSIQFPKKYTQSIQALKSMPYPHQGKIVPLSASGNFTFTEEPKGFYRENGKEIITISGRAKESANHEDKLKNKQRSLKLTQKFISEQDKASTTRIEIKNPGEELDQAISQLLTAVGVSILLIFLLMILLFGSWVDSLLILLAIPFGILGTLISLTIFKSNLSLNSALGVILLNGIAVANSIILVDFIKELKKRGESPKDAAIKAARVRLRPILMTSLATVLGMLPIALGLGSGGKILQPLGLSVAGGLWVSMIFTLYFVPTLQSYYYTWMSKNE